MFFKPKKRKISLDSCFGPRGQTFTLPHQCVVCDKTHDITTQTLKVERKFPPSYTRRGEEIKVKVPIPICNECLDNSKKFDRATNIAGTVSFLIAFLGFLGFITNMMYDFFLSVILLFVPLLVAMILYLPLREVLLRRYQLKGKLKQKDMVGLEISDAGNILLWTRNHKWLTRIEIS